MKFRMKQLMLSTCAITLLGNINFASADVASDTETLLNWAENTHPEFFPNHRATQSTEPWLYRFYPETNTYAGVNKNDNGVYVLGGSWGNNPTFIDTLPGLINHIANTGGNGSIPACNIANVPAEMVFTQSDNVVNVTTNGKCIEFSGDTNLCKTPAQPAATGISVLRTSGIPLIKLSGVTFNSPVDPSKFSPPSTDYCTINAPAEQANLVVNTDVCVDMTTQLEASLKDLIVLGVATVDPPITLAAKSTSTSKVVPDCFATNAGTIHDAFTNEVWIKQNGAFVKVDN